MVSGHFQRISIIIILLIIIATLGNNTTSLELWRLRLRDMEWLSHDHTEPGLARRSFDLNPPVFHHPMEGPVAFFHVERLRAGVDREMTCPEALSWGAVGSHTVRPAGHRTSTREQEDGLAVEAIFKFKASRSFREGRTMDLRPFLGLWETWGWVGEFVPSLSGRSPLSSALDSSLGPEVPALCHPSQHLLIQSN